MGAGGLQPAGPFRTILFPPGRESTRQERSEAPAFFPDLNLDQLVGWIVGKRDEAVLSRTVEQSQSAVAKGFDKASGFGEDTYVALMRQLDAAGQNFRD